MKSEELPNIARKEGRKGAGKEGRKEGRDDEPGLAFIPTPDSLLARTKTKAPSFLLSIPTTETLPFQNPSLVFCS